LRTPCVSTTECKIAISVSGIEDIHLQPLNFTTEFDAVISRNPTGVGFKLSGLPVGEKGLKIPGAEAGEARRANVRVSYREIKHGSLQADIRIYIPKGFRFRGEVDQEFVSVPTHFGGCDNRWR
jgi:hypothetical protein